MTISNGRGAALRQATEASRLIAERIDALVEMQKAAEIASNVSRVEQKKAAEEAQREYGKLIDSIANVSQEKLGDTLFSAMKGESLDFADVLKDTLLHAIGDVLARTRANAAHDVARRSWRPARRAARPDQRMKLIMRGHRRRCHRRR